MIYTVDDNKHYSLGKREAEQVCLTITEIKPLRIESGSVFCSKITASKTLLLVTSGSITVGDRKIKKGSVIYISKFANYNISAVEPAEVIKILFEYTDDRLVLFRENIRIFEAALETAEYINKIYYNRFYINTLSGVNEALLLNVLNMLNILCVSYSTELGLYQKFCEWLESSCCVTAEQAAAAMGCSVAHLNRTVKKYCNQCLSTVICEKMISEIKRLMKYSNCSTKEIALKLGFGSPELLRKFFKYHTGMSLKEFKAKNSMVYFHV